MALDHNGHQGLYGESYISMLASAAGLLASKPVLDVDGIDWQIAHPGPRGTKRSPKLELQVKSDRSPERTIDAFKYRLSVKRYNKLAGPGFDVPRFFALVVVPESPLDYVTCSHDSMVLSHAAYWTSFVDQELEPVGDEHPKSVAFAVPRSNLLTVHTLLALIDGDLKGAQA